jgi:hypothetical protein
MPGDGSRQVFSFTALLAPGGTQIVSQSAWVRDALAWLMWVDPGSAVFSQCGADLHLVECADRVRRLTAQKVAVQSKVDVG